MDRFSDDFNRHSEVARVTATAQDFDDLQHAIAGREVGRHRKHILGSGVDPVTGEKKGRIARAIQRTLEWLLLNDPGYAHVHTRAMTKLADAESVTTDALTRIIDALAAERAVLGNMETRAARLGDGTLVFRKANGEVVDGNGNLIPDHLAAGIAWRGDEPSFEEYTAQKQRIEDLLAAEAQLRGVEAQLGDIRGELTDENAPPSPDRIGTLTERIDDLVRQTRQIAPRQQTNASEIDAPDLSRARDDEIVVPTIKIGG